MARGKYQEWLTEEGLLAIESWASDGLLNKDIALNIGITEGTFNNWCSKFGEINEALKKGRAPVVRAIENALIKNAKGFEYEEQTIEMWVDDGGNKKQKIIKHQKYSRPDSSAAMFLLKNYKPNKYRNYTDLTKRQIEAEIKKLEAEAELAKHDLAELTETPIADDDGFIEALQAEDDKLWQD